MTTRHKNFKSISGRSRNDAHPMYIHYKISKSRETVPLNSVDVEFFSAFTQSTKSPWVLNQLTRNETSCQLSHRQLKKKIDYVSDFKKSKILKSFIL
jgi:hypothetical protein